MAPAPVAALISIVLLFSGCRAADSSARIDAAEASVEDPLMVDESPESAAADAPREAADPQAPVQVEPRPPPIEGGEPITLPPAGSVHGVRRHAPLALAEGIDNDAPALAVTVDGKVIIAFVSRARDDTETIMLRVAASASAEPGPPRVASSGARAWNPVLAAGPDGSAWMAWCGRDRPDARGDHRRSVYLRKVWPRLGEIVTVSGGEGRSCDPALDVAPDGTVHLAWEAEDRVAWRAYDGEGRPASGPLIVSEGPLDRRPAILAGPGEAHIAWDRLELTRAADSVDPRYQVLMRVWTAQADGQGSLGPIIRVDFGEGIRAAPALARSPDGEGVLIAYHSSERHPLVKWWRLRRLGADGSLVELELKEAAGEREPQGEQQGAEFPAIAVAPDGRIVILTRPSQGAYLHLVGPSEVGPPLDLTRRGWGARGVRARAAFAPDGTLLAVRRARHESVLERFTFEAESLGSPSFRPVEAATPSLPNVSSPGARLVDPELLGGSGEARRIVFGDPHMHSALSDGTGPGDEIYARALARGLDFAVLTDHDYIVGSRMFPSKHAEIVWITDWFNRLEGFATLHGFEWTTPPVPRGFGHRNVYFRGRPMVPQPGFRDGYPDTPALHRALAEQEAFTAAHHTAWTGTDWENLDPKVQRHVEVVSVHGVFERESMEDVPIEPRGEILEGLAVRGLSAGHVFGFLGGSDAHGLLWHHGLGRRRNPWDQGLTAALVTDLTREAIFDAMYARSTFATSGAPMILVASVAGLGMGEEGAAEGPVVVRWSYETTAEPIYLMVLRDGEPVHRLKLEERSGSGSWVDSEAGEGRAVYYLRLVQGRGSAGVDVAWSSPVFLNTRSQ